nr:putative ribonuclease h protein [Quercus suber]
MLHEAKMIKSIPLCFTDAEDKLYWPSKVNGIYSVKAGCRLLIEDELISSTGPLTPPHPKSKWKGLWKLRISNRTKTLLWRAISDALPTRVHLVKRKVLSNATCQLCGLEQEYTLHALWSCLKLNEVWDMHFGSLRDDAKECSTFLEVFQVCMEKAHPTNMLAMVTSQIWLRRNKLRLGETVVDLRLLNSFARDALLEF